MSGLAATSSADDEPYDSLAGRRVVHLVGRIDVRAAEHLVAMTAALSSRGVPQTVVMVNDQRQREPLPWFDPSVRTVMAGGPFWQTPRGLLRALLEEVAREPIVAVHTHGPLACLVGIFAARFLDLPAPLHITFDAHRTPVLLERTLMMLWHSVAPTQTLTWQRTPEQTDWAEPDVSEVFFEQARHEAERPLVVTAGNESDTHPAGRFAQLAVLLQSSGLAFSWLGPVDGDAAAQFAAAGVDQHDAGTDVERAARLRAAWLYVDFGGSAASLQRLAEAMSCGLPCVAWETPARRAPLEHDHSGLLCDSEESLLDCVAELVDSPELRARLGRTAREQARKRFSPAGRSEALLASYRTAAAH